MGLLMLILFVTYMLFEGYQFRSQFAFTNGTVTKITLSGYRSPGDYSILYEYKVNGDLYHGNNNGNYCSGQNMGLIKELLVGKQFPVVYGTKKPSMGFIMLNQKYANKYNYKLPDSVRYYDSVLNCK